jgi:hypothetical protein
MLFSEEGEEDTEEGTDLAHPENKHPANEIGLRFGDLNIKLANLFDESPLEFLLDDGQDVHLRLPIGLVEQVHECSSAVLPQLVAEDLRQGNDWHKSPLIRAVLLYQTAKQAARFQ